MNSKTQCGYCGGYTFDDRAGNCAACGGPRASVARHAEQVNYKSMEDYLDRMKYSSCISDGDVRALKRIAGLT